MGVVRIGIDDDTFKCNRNTILKPGDTVILEAYGPYVDIAGRYISVAGHSCSECLFYDYRCAITCKIHCGKCVIKDPSDLLEEI